MGDSAALSTSQFLAKLETFEGGNLDHLYLDSEGKVTVGIGLMFPSAEALKKSALRFKFATTGKYVGTDEIGAEYKRISAEKKGYRAAYYRKKTILRADKNQLYLAFLKRYKIAQADAVFFFNTGTVITDAIFEKFDELPVNVRYALEDMAFNLGRPKLIKYQALRKYLKLGEWKEAATESKRKGIASNRNTQIFKWIESQPVSPKKDGK